MPTHPIGRIGPNAIIQTVAALKERMGPDKAAALLGARGHGALLSALPTGMVDESEVTALSESVVEGLGHAAGLAVMERAGVLTAQYLLAHRIPWVARALLPHLPDRIALRLLFRAIAEHSWTFAGTGRFSVTAGARPGFEIAGCPICRNLKTAVPACAYYRATFEELLRRLVHPAAMVQEVACSAMGAPTCRFAILLH